MGYLSVCYGAAARHLGLLAATMSHWAEAEQHFEEALKMNAKLEAGSWLAHTQHEYAAMLLARGHGADRDKAICCSTRLWRRRASWACDL